MSFQKPQILWFLLCLAIPIIIHFIRLRKAKTIYFPGVFRLIKAEKTTHQNRQIKNWLLLLNRLLIFTTIILSFAQPSCNNSGPGKSKIKNIYMWLDLSPSMFTINENGQTSLEIAKSKISNFLENSSSESIFHFYNYDIKRFEQFSSDDLKKYILTINDVKIPVRISDLIISNQLELNEDGNNLLIAFSDRRGQIWDSTSKISTDNLTLIDCNSVGDFNNRFISNAIITDSNTLRITVDRVKFDSKEELEISLELDNQYSGSKKLSFEENQKQIFVDLPIMRNYQTYLVSISSDEYPLDDALYGHKPLPRKMGVYLSRDEPQIRKLIDVLNDKFELDDSLRSNAIRIVEEPVGLNIDSMQNLGLTMIIPASNKLLLSSFGKGEWINDTVQLNEKSFNSSWFDAALSSNVNPQTQLPSVTQYWKFEYIPTGFEALITNEENNPILLARKQEESYTLIWLVDWEKGMNYIKQSLWFVPIFSQLLQLNNISEESTFGIWGNGQKLEHPSFLNHSLDLPVNIVGNDKEWIANLEISPSGEYLPLEFAYEKSGFFKIEVSDSDSFAAGLNISREESLNLELFDLKKNNIGTLIEGNIDQRSIIEMRQSPFNFLYLSLLFILTEILLLVFGNKTKM